MSQIPVSAVVICSNAAETITQCCTSLARFDEVLIYLNNSTDDTEALCRPFENVTLVQGEFVGFGATKNAAVAAARNNWVFSLDSDEFANEQLVEAIAGIDRNSSGVAYTVLRQNRFCGRHVDKGGWGNDILLRVFHRESAAFNDKPVHEKVEPTAGVSVARLDGVLWHDAVVRLDQFLQKISYYSELNARDVKPKALQHPFFALIRAQFRFFRSYVLQLGFLAGWRGLVIAWAGATGTFFKYSKRYTKSRQLER
ncbi:MAG: glycosyltransferase family 2 protein [Pseudomonadota bacterium]